MKTWEVLAIAHKSQISASPIGDGSRHPDQQDLEQLALGKAVPDDQIKMEAHLRDCGLCQKGFEEALLFADHLRELLKAQGRQDVRKAVRYQVRESAIIMLCHPVESAPVIGQVIDVSATGLRIRLPRPIHRGSQVQVQVEKAVIFGTVRYCRDIGNGLSDVGMVIDQVVMSMRQPRTPDAIHVRKHSARPDSIDVLLVEDNPADVRLMEMLFQDIRIKYRLTVASDGAQALGRLLDPTIPKPNLVLLDLNLPKVSGLDVLKTLRQEQSTESVTVAVLSSSKAASDLQRSTALGIRAYLTKPKNIHDCRELRTSLDALVSDAVH